MAIGEKRTKITVLLTKEEFERFDAYCRANGFKKSTLIAKMIADRLEEEGFVVQRGLFDGEGGATEGYVNP